MASLYRKYRVFKRLLFWKHFQMTVEAGGHNHWYTDIFLKNVIFSSIQGILMYTHVCSYIRMYTNGKRWVVMRKHVKQSFPTYNKCIPIIIDCNGGSMTAWLPLNSHSFILISIENQWKNNENQWKPMKINGNQWKSMRIQWQPIGHTSTITIYKLFGIPCYMLENCV